MSQLPKVTADAWLIPSLNPARQEAIDRIYADLYRQGREPFDNPTESFTAHPGMHRFVLSHRASEPPTETQIDTTATAHHQENRPHDKHKRQRTSNRTNGRDA